MHNKTSITHYLLPVTLTILLAACGNNPEQVALNTQQDTLSWAMGMSLAQTVQSGFFEFDNDLVRQAFENTLNGGKQPIDDETYAAARDYIGFLAMQKNRQQAKASAENADTVQSQCFARLTAENPNLHKAPEGYYYEVIREGKGPKAQIGLRISLDFKATNMLTGETIEQTFGVRDPIIHVLDQPMFEGMLCGLQLMNAGSRYRFYFPYQLVRGANGIPPYTPVIYEVELHEIYND